MAFLLCSAKQKRKSIGPHSAAIDWLSQPFFLSFSLEFIGSGNAASDSNCHGRGPRSGYSKCKEKIISHRMCPILLLLDTHTHTAIQHVSVIRQSARCARALLLCLFVYALGHLSVGLVVVRGAKWKRKCTSLDAWPYGARLQQWVLSACSTRICNSYWNGMRSICGCVDRPQPHTFAVKVQMRISPTSFHGPKRKYSACFRPTGIQNDNKTPIYLYLLHQLKTHVFFVTSNVFFATRNDSKEHELCSDFSSVFRIIFFCFCFFFGLLCLRLHAQCVFSGYAYTRKKALDDVEAPTQSTAIIRSVARSRVRTRAHHTIKNCMRKRNSAFLRFRTGSDAIYTRFFPYFVCCVYFISRVEFLFV